MGDEQNHSVLGRQVDRGEVSLSATSPGASENPPSAIRKYGVAEQTHGRAASPEVEDEDYPVRPSSTLCFMMSS